MRALVLALALGPIGCGASGPSESAASRREPVIATPLAAPVATPREERAEPREHASIGTASFADDGSIVLELRAEVPGGGLGHGQLRYPPDHPEHAAVLAHLGGLRPGESKPVPPWP
jgi:hypothetical protein